MEIDRRAFIAALGGAAAIETMQSEELADALEHHMMDAARSAGRQNNQLVVRRGAGSLFSGRGTPNADGRLAAPRARADAANARRSSTSSSCASRRRRTCCRARPTR